MRARLRLASALVAAGLVAIGGSRARGEEGTDPAALLARGEYDQAAQVLAPRAEADAKSALALARARFGLGRYEDAARLAARAAKDAALAAEAAAVEAESLAAVGKVDDAIALLRKVEAEPTARRARLVLGALLIERGRRAEARAPLMTIIDDYNRDAIGPGDAEGLTLVGRAAHLLRSPRDANDAYGEAEKAGGKQRVDTLLDRAELFLDKYDPGHAAEVVREAEALAPNDPRVRVLKARVVLDNAMDFDSAEGELRRALAVNPRLAEAHFWKAGLALRDLDIEAADRAADEGLAVNPNDLRLLAMKAAIRFLADDPKGFDAFEKRALGLNPSFSEFYQIVGEFAEWEHRYDDIVAMMQKAVAIDARDAKAHAALGLNLIRAGRESEGVAALQTAWKTDRFNVRVFNTLNLFERDVPAEYTTVDGQTFRMRYAKDEAEILARYVPRMLEEAWGSMVKRYGFTPSTPIAIELYAEDEHFSVRTSGLPHVGIQGVCFGKTLALLSPRAAPFNWGNVLWHELGHVFAIQLSKNHVPRWFTEGLSEYETIVRRPEWQREEDPALHAALEAGRIPSVGAFNRAFTHVDSVEEVTMAYYAASQLVVFLVERYGWDKVVSTMPRWAKGERTPEVLRAALGASIPEIDEAYRAWLHKRLARYDAQFVPDLHAPGDIEDAEEAVAKAPNDPRKQLELAIARLRAGKTAEGRAALDAALRLDPNHPDALFVSAELALEADESPAQSAPDRAPPTRPTPPTEPTAPIEPQSTGEEKTKLEDGEAARADRARAILQRLATSGHDGYAVQMKLAAIAESTDDRAGQKRALIAAAAHDPSQPAPLAGLVDLARSVRDERTELEHLARYVKLEQHDRAAWGRLLEGLVARGRWEEAVQVGEGAVFVDVATPEIHRLYARALAKTGRFVSAIFEYNSAIVAGAPPPMAQEIYRELARGYDKLGQTADAERARTFEREVAARVDARGTTR